MAFDISLNSGETGFDVNMRTVESQSFSESLSIVDTFTRQAGKFLRDVFTLIDTIANLKTSASVFKQATVNPLLIPSTQTDFPAYVDLSRIGITTLAEAQSVRVYADSGKVTELARQIVSVSQMFVRIPSFTTTTTVYVDYDGVRADYAVTDTYGRNATWPSQFVLASHFEEDPSAANQINSTGGTVGVDEGSMTSGDLVTGKVGNGLDFDGSDDQVRYSNSAYQNFATTATWAFAAWFKSSKTTDFNLIENRDTSTTPFLSIVVAGASDQVGMFNRAASAARHYTTGTTTVSDGVWRRAWFTRDGSLNGVGGASGAQQIYLNGVKETIASETVDTAAASNYGSGGTLRVGGGLNGYLQGVMDEIYLWSGSIPSQDWITTDYNNQSNEASFWGTWTTVTFGSSYTKTLTEVIAVIDNFVRQPSRFANELVTIVDSLSRSTSRSLSEMVTIVDRIFRTSVRLLSEVITVVDTVRVRIAAKILNEVVTVVDTVSRSVNRALSEVLTVVDTISRITGRLLNEAVLLVDSITLTKVTSRAYAEAITIVDTFSRNISRALSEVVTVVDRVARTTSKFFFDAFTVVDTATITKVTARAFTEVITVLDTIIVKITARILTETLTIIDTLNRTPARAFQEVVTVIDTVAKSISKSFIEVLTVLDSVRRSVSRALTETLTVVDNFSRQMSRVFIEVVTVLDTVAALLFTIKTLVRAETITVVDSLSRSTGRLLSEAVTVTDSIVRSTGRFLSEAMTVVDTFARSLSITKALSEVVTVVDAIRVRFSAKMFSEALTVTDNFFRTLSRRLVESILVTDLIGFFKKARGYMMGYNKNTNTGIGKGVSAMLGYNKNTNTGIGKKNPPQVGRNKNTNTGIGKKLE